MPLLENSGSAGLAAITISTYFRIGNMPDLTNVRFPDSATESHLPPTPLLALSGLCSASLGLAVLEKNSAR